MRTVSRKSAAAACVFAAAFAVSSVAGPEDPPARPVPPPAPAAHPLEGFWELRMERRVWWPYAVPGSLAVWRGPAGLRGSVTFDPMWGIEPKPLKFEASEGGRVAASLSLGGEHLVRIDGEVRDGVFVGKTHWEGAEPAEVAPVSAERIGPLRRLEPDSAGDPFPLETDPARAGVDPTALDRLIHYASRYDTDALYVVKDGRVVCDRTFLRPRGRCTTQSVTKAIASFAIPLLIEEGRIPRDLDTPLTKWFPQWKDDARKARITLRHVLTHSTGLDSDGTQAMQASDDYLAFATASAALHEPGTRYAYSNQAMELLSGIIAQASGEQADAYLGRKLFKPLGIAKVRWSKDDAGNTPTYAGIDLPAANLARIGWMTAKRGRWQDRQVVPEWWFDALVVPSALHEELGLVWQLKRAEADEKVVQTKERLDALRARGWADADRLAPLVGRTFDGRRAWWTAVMGIVGKDGAKDASRHLPHPAVGGEVRGPVSCVYHSGSMGQYLLVLPAKGLVVVRQRRGFAADELPKDVAERAGFQDVIDLAMDLVP